MIKDFFKELRLRLSNPLFTSFVISWSIINWKVWICLLKYTTPETSLDGFKSPIHLISSVVSCKSGLIHPLTIAIAYVGLWPIFRNLIHIFNAWVDTIGGNRIVKISNRRTVPIDVYLAQKADRDKAESALLEELQSQSHYKAETIRLNGDLNDLTRKYNDESSAARRIQNYSDVMFYDGEWELSYMIDSEQRKDVVQLRAGEIRSTDRERRMLFKITRIAYLRISNEVMITMEDHMRQSPPVLHYMILVANNELDILTNNVQGQPFDRLVKRK
jgi:hypothetical protein